MVVFNMVLLNPCKIQYYSFHTVNERSNTIGNKTYWVQDLIV